MIKGHKLSSKFSQCLWHLLPYGRSGLLCNRYSCVSGVFQPTFLNHQKFINTMISSVLPNLTESPFSRKPGMEVPSHLRSSCRRAIHTYVMLKRVLFKRGCSHLRRSPLFSEEEEKHPSFLLFLSISQGHILESFKELTAVNFIRKQHLSNIPYDSMEEISNASSQKYSHCCAILPCLQEGHMYSKGTTPSLGTSLLFLSANSLSIHFTTQLTVGFFF